MLKQFNKPYDPKEVEDKIYRLWEKSGYFNPDKLPGNRKKPFTIIMPPPNANGALHFGHALFVTLEDLMVRYKRMAGYKTLWLPGADHAGFETQVVYDKKLEKEGRNRFQIPRDELYDEMLKFTLANKKTMENQLRKLGSSCDWSREKFTLDKDIIETVYNTFKKLYEDGLVYRDSRIINWCIKHQTSLSELEINWEEKIDKLYYVRYFLPDKKDYITVATTRPETIPGDVAIAVNPKDARYKNWVGKKVEKSLPSLVSEPTGKYIFVIADKAVDPDFGTGVLKITPAHDAADFEIGKRNNLETIDILNPNGRLNEFTGELQGMKVAEARTKAVEILKKNNALEKIEDYKHQVAICYKCKNIIEPMILPQWYIRMTEKSKSGGDSLRDAAVKSVKSSKIKFVPKRFEKVFFHWMKNLRDWNISRQIVWGIRIPIWYCDNCLGIQISSAKPGGCPTCKSNKLHQDSDVFDTWFSSGQWPFAALDYPNSKDFKTFYPTDVMETGWDILFFWVARMIMLGIYRTGKIPFHTVYLHGLVRDQDRQKMSKSKGNVIDPLGVAEIYGADAVRMALIIGATPGNDPVISEDKIKGYRNFANKIWNITRFVLENIKDVDMDTEYTKEDKNVRNYFDKIILKEVNKNIENYRFDLAAETLYHYVWHRFADMIIEHSKTIFKVGTDEEKASRKKLLLLILKDSVKLLHPFMPFITEEIYQQLPIKNKKLLMIEKW